MIETSAYIKDLYIWNASIIIATCQGGVKCVNKNMIIVLRSTHISFFKDNEKQDIKQGLHG